MQSISGRKARQRCACTAKAADGAGERGTNDRSGKASLPMGASSWVL